MIKTWLNKSIQQFKELECVGKGILFTSMFFLLQTVGISYAQITPQISTQSQGLVFNASTCPGCPGFDPSELVKHAGATTNINGSAVSGIYPFFNDLSAGAITDNMFGIVSSIDPGPDGIVQTDLVNNPLVALGDDIPLSECGTTIGTMTNNLPGLNCGILRVDPSSQGVSFPSGDINSLRTFTVTAPTFIDFEPADDLHVGFDLLNTYVNNCQPVIAGCNSSVQKMKQVTSVGIAGNAGTLSVPGSGDQMLELNVAWSNTGNSNCGTTCTYTDPVITWSFVLTQPAPDPTLLAPNPSTMTVFGTFLNNSGDQPTVPFSPGAISTTKMTLP